MTEVGIQLFFLETAKVQEDTRKRRFPFTESLVFFFSNNQFCLMASNEGQCAFSGGDKSQVKCRLLQLVYKRPVRFDTV